MYTTVYTSVWLTKALSSLVPGSSSSCVRLHRFALGGRERFFSVGFLFRTSTWRRLWRCILLRCSTLAFLLYNWIGFLLWLDTMWKPQALCPWTQLNKPKLYVYNHRRKWWNTVSHLGIFQASGPKCQCVLVLGVVIFPHNGRSVDFGSASPIGSACRSPFQCVIVLVCSRLPIINQVRFVTYGRVSRATTMLLPLRMVIPPDLSKYKLLYFAPLPIFRLPLVMCHDNSVNVFLYPSSANIPMETRILLRSGTCLTGCRVIALPFGSRMGISPIPAIRHSCPLPSQTMLSAPTE